MDFDVVTGQILERIDIVELISRYISLKKRGKNFLGLCPFHTEKTPSFSVSPDKQIFKCFGCGKGGNAIHFVMEYEKLSFKETLQQLAKVANVSLEFTRDDHKDEKTSMYEINRQAANFFENELIESDPNIKKYLSDRGINSDTLNHFKVGYAPDQWDKLFHFLKNKHLFLKHAEQLGLLSMSRHNNYIDRFRNRIMFSIMDLSGHILGFGGRIINGDDQSAKYINSPESIIYQKSDILYGLFQARDAIKEKDHVIFVEGYMDVLQLYQNGIKNVVATSGTAFTERQARLIKRFTQNIYLCYDSDPAGQAAILKAGMMILNFNFEVKVILLEKGEDPDSYVKQNGAGAFMIKQEQAWEFSRFFLNYFTSNYNMNQFRERQNAQQKAIEMLSELNNPLLANFLVEELAFVTNSAVQPLKQQMETLKSQKSRYAKKTLEVTDSTREYAGSAIPAEERDIIILLLQNNPTVIGLILDIVTPDFFTNAEIREIFSEICETHAEYGEIVPKRILSAIRNQSMIEIITKKLMEDFVDPVKYTQDTLLRLQYRNAKQELEKLAVKIKKDEKGDKIDPELLNRYQDALNMLRKFREKLNPT